MKVLTQHVVILDREFVLVSDYAPDLDATYYGTISYDDIDADGKLARVLNGFDMCISFESISQALKNREQRILLDIFEKEAHPTDAERMFFVFNGYTTDNWDWDEVARIEKAFDSLNNLGEFSKNY